MTPTDPHFAMAAARRAELELDARRYRQQRAVARQKSSAVLRLYARLWWASRPRVAAWGPPPRLTGRSLLG